MPIIALFLLSLKNCRRPLRSLPWVHRMGRGGRGIGEVEGEEGANIGSLAPSVKREERCSFSPPPPQ